MTTGASSVGPPASSSSRLTAVGVAVATGLSWAAAHPEPGWWWLVLVVVPGWLTAVHLVRSERRPVVFGVGFVLGLSAFLPMLRWLGNIPGGDIAWPLLSAVLALYVGAASSVVRRWTTSRWVAVVGPVVWTGAELLRARWPLGGFGWGDLASAHTPDSWMWTVPRVLGADGLTLMTALLGACAWATISTALRVRHEVEVEEGRTVVPAAARTVATVDAVRPLMLATVGVAILGTLVTVGPPPVTGTVDVLVVQANDASSPATGAELDRVIAEAHADATEAAVAADGPPDLTVWAENAVDRDPTTANGDDLLPAVLRATEALGGPLLAGVTADGDDPTTFRNTVTAFAADGTVSGRYVKRQVVPFGEYVPFRPLLGDLPPLRLVPRDAIPGDGPVTLDVAGVGIAPVICFETLFGPIVRSAVAADDAGLVVAVTNDASYGYSDESAQHVAQSQLRAVETGRAVVHAAISGTSAIVLPDGTVTELAPLFEVATIRHELPVVSGSTPAMVVAGPLSAVLLLAALGVVLVGVGRTVLDHRRAAGDEEER